MRHGISHECGFAQCRGNTAVESAHCPEDFAKRVWGALTPEAKCTSPRKVAVARMASVRASSIPLWCCMITRLVGLKTAEASCDGARAAVALEKKGPDSRDTWDLSQVQELSDCMKDDRFDTVLAGRVFVIIGGKNSEQDQPHWKYRARAVFQGNTITTRSGRL